MQSLTAMGATIERVDESGRYLEAAYSGTLVLIHLQPHDVRESVLIVAARENSPNDLELAREVFQRVQSALQRS